VSIDPKQLPDDPKILQKMVLDLIGQLDRESTERHKIEGLLRELLDAKRNRKSEQFSADQLLLFAAAWQARQAEAKVDETSDSDDPDGGGGQPGGGDAAAPKKKTSGRPALPAHLECKRVVHDLAEAEKYCNACQQDLREIGEESSKQYEYIPARVIVVEHVCKKYACQCTVQTATKPPQPIEKSTAGASLLAQVIVAKVADHLPLNRQQQIFQREGINISRKTMCGWMGKCADLLNRLYGSLKEVLFQSLVIGTDDTGVKTLDLELPFARTGRIWPYCGDRQHPVIVYDYTATRERAGPEEFLKGYQGYLQADAYVGYDALYKDPGRGLTEVGCWAHARRYYYKALESDEAHMGPALYLIADLYGVEERARKLTPEERLGLRQAEAQPIMDKLRDYLLEIQPEVLPKSPAGRAVSYTLKNWTALTRYLKDGNLEIDNNATERAIRGVAIGRNNWIFFGSDEGGKTAALLRSFVASCQRVGVDPFAWFKDILSRISSHPINRLKELLPHNWAPSAAYCG
jgi:transposase